jgi:hypothetical protein
MLESPSWVCCGAFRIADNIVSACRVEVDFPVVAEWATIGIWRVPDMVIAAIVEEFRCGGVDL